MHIDEIIVGERYAASYDGTRKLTVSVSTSVLPGDMT